MAIDVTVTDAAVEVDITGLDQVWALRRGLRLPIPSITSAKVVPTREAERHRGLRLPGTYWPGRIAAGTFLIDDRPGERAFWFVRRAGRVLVIETTDPRPRFVVLEHESCDDLAWWIGERIG